MISFEKILNAVRLSNTLCSLPSGSTVIVGGKVVTTTSALQVNTATSGVGGLDTGVIAASTFYYLYAIRSAGIHYLVASLSATSPTGFTAYRKVGAFYTDGVGVIFKVYPYESLNILSFHAKVAAIGTVSDQSSPFMDGNFTNASDSVGNFLTGIFSLSPNCFINLVNYSLALARTGFPVSATPTTVTFRRGVVAGAGTTTEAYNVQIHKQGVDAIQPDWKHY